LQASVWIKNLIRFGKKKTQFKSTLECRLFHAISKALASSRKQRLANHPQSPGKNNYEYRGSND
jgi:hypothetical protein